MRIFPSFVVVIGICILLTGMNACQTSQVRNADSEKAKQKKLAQENKMAQVAIRSRNQKKPAQEIQAWETLLQAVPDSRYKTHALRRLVSLYHKEKKWQKALPHIKILLKMSNLSLRHQQEAKVWYGKSLYELKKDKAAVSYLEKHYKELPMDLCRKGLQVLVDAYYRNEKVVQSVKWLVKKMACYTPAKRHKMKGLILSYIFARFNRKQIQKIYYKHRNQTDFPFDHIALRVAEIRRQQRYYHNMKLVLQNFIKRAGTTHPLFFRAQKLLLEIHRLHGATISRTIGVIYPATGKGASIGKEIKRTLDLVLRDYPKIHLVYMDSGSGSKNIERIVNTLYQRHQVIAIFGAITPSVAKKAAVRAQALKIPLFSLTIAENFPSIGSYIFRNNFTLSMMARAVARYSVKKLLIHHFGVFFPNSRYGQVQAIAFEKEVKKLGAKITSSSTYVHNSPDFEEHLRDMVGKDFENAKAMALKKKMLKDMSYIQKKRLKEKIKKHLRPLPPFEALFIPDGSKMVSLIAPHLVYLNVPLKKIEALGVDRSKFPVRTRYKSIQLLGSNGWHEAGLFRNGWRHIRHSLFCVRYFPFRPHLLARRFLFNYSQAYKMRPIHLSAHVYDTIRLLIFKASSPKIQNRKQLRDALLQVKGFDGITGHLKILSNGETVGPVYFLRASKKSFVYEGKLRVKELL